MSFNDHQNTYYYFYTINILETYYAILKLFLQLSEKKEPVSLAEHKNFGLKGQRFTILAIYSRC